MQNIHYHQDPKDRDILFDDRFRQVVTAMARVSGETATVDVFSDATLKKNKLPTGVAITTPKQNAILLPNLLRDPGCGFLSFSVCYEKTPEPHWHERVGE